MVLGRSIRDFIPWFWFGSERLCLLSEFILYSRYVNSLITTYLSWLKVMFQSTFQRSGCFVFSLNDFSIHLIYSSFWGLINILLHLRLNFLLWLGHMRIHTALWTWYNLNLFVSFSSHSPLSGWMSLVPSRLLVSESVISNVFVKWIAILNWPWSLLWYHYDQELSQLTK